MPKRVLLLALVAWSVTLLHAVSWQEYKARFVAKDGRVIDRKNGDITHSEAVGYTLFLATCHDDRPLFDKVLTWAHNNLFDQKNGLYGWKWGKAADGTWHLLDANNATDGDLWIAYALIRMGRATGQERYRKEAQKLLAHIKEKLLITIAGRTYLLPGRQGFVHGETVRLNPSYILLPLYRRFAAFDSDPIWKQLEKDGEALLWQARFGPFLLHPDWITLEKRSGNLVKDTKMRFGYDAIRVPLTWLQTPGSSLRMLEGYARYLKSMQAGKTVFGTCDLRKGLISLEDHSRAFYAIYDRIAKAFGLSDDFVKLYGKRVDDDDYYSFTITLIASCDLLGTER